MKIAFFGTGEFSASILKSLVEDFKKEVKVKISVSQEDKAVGRKRELVQTAVKKLSIEKNIEIIQPNRIKISAKTSEQKKNEIKSFYKKIKSLDLDFIVVVSYGKIIPNEILESAKYGCINIHGSILPKYRGASPIQESIKMGDTQTGLTIMYMNEQMDEGDILSIEKVEIEDKDTTHEMFKKFEKIGPKLLIETLKGVIKGEIKGEKQQENKATYCGKISKQDGEINFKEKTGEEIYNMFRAYKTWPGIYSLFGEKKLNFEDIEIEKTQNTENNIGKIIKIEDKENKKNKKIGIISKGAIIILKKVKLEGKSSMDILSFVNGNKKFLDYKF